MKLTKIVFNGSISGVFGDSVSALTTIPNPSMGIARDLEATPLGVVVTRMDGTRCLVQPRDCGTGELAPDVLAEGESGAGRAAPKAKAR